MTKTLASAASAVVLAAALTACGAASTAAVDGGGASQTVAVNVQPSTAEVAPTRTLQFAAVVTGAADTAVSWSVTEAGGGSVNANGLYTAPSGPGTYHVEVRSHADPTVFARATITVTAAPAVQVTISPRTTSVVAGRTATFTATVLNATNRAVTWRVQEASGCGSVSAGGVYTAPGAAATCHVVATSVADASKSDTATIAVTAAPAVTVAIAPRTTSVAAGGTVTFSATVQNASSTAVTYRVQEASGCGSVTAAGVYTAPGAAATCHVVATSAADTSKSDTATVTVTAPPVVTVAVSPSTAAINSCLTQTFTATVTGATDTSVTWSVVETGGGTVTSAGVYTAPTDAGTYHVRATSRAAGTTRDATVTVTDRIVSVAVGPDPVTVTANGTVQFQATVTTTCGSTQSLQEVPVTAAAQ